MKGYEEKRCVKCIKWCQKVGRRTIPLLRSCINAIMLGVFDAFLFIIMHILVPQLCSVIRPIKMERYKGHNVGYNCSKVLLVHLK